MARFRGLLVMRDDKEPGLTWSSPRYSDGHVKQLGEIDVASDSGLAGPIDQSDQGGPLGTPASSTDENDHAVVQAGLSKLQEIIAIAGDEHTSTPGRVLEDLGVIGGWIKHVGHAEDLMSELDKRIGNIDRNVMIQQEPHPSGAI